MAHLRLMTNNQWKMDENCPAWEKRGLDCSGKVREQGFAALYHDLAPDVIGMQEVSFRMADYLVRDLAALGDRYALLFGRDTPILYRQDKFELVDSDFALFPDSVPGLEGIFNNDHTKSYCIAAFRVKENGKMFVFATTHLWWKSDNPEVNWYQKGSGEARSYQIGLIIERTDAMQKKYGCPAVLVGDFNTDYASSPVRTALENGFLHAHDLATECRAEDNGWHPCGPSGFAPYEPKPFEKGIDHILVKNAPDGFVRRFERTSPASYLPLSDHFPAWIDVEI